MNRRQYTIRNVPPSLDRVLRERASARGMSLNKVLLDALEREAGVGSEPRSYDDLDALIGRWVRDEAVDRALAEQRVVDPRDWR